MVIKPKIVAKDEGAEKPLSSQQLHLLDYIQDIVMELEDLTLACELPDVNTALRTVQKVMKETLKKRVNTERQYAHPFQR